MSDIPILETPRLVLRAHRLADFDAMASMWADPLVTRHIGGRPSTPEESWARLLRYAGLWSLLGYGFWAITEKAGGGFIGEGGFADFRRGVDFPGGAASPEAGWALVTAAHGRGLATEALRAMLAWGDRHFAGGSTMCIVNPDNLASVRVAGKCGYVETGRCDYRGEPVIVFRR